MMGQQDRNQLGILIGNMALYYRQQTNRDVIKMMVDDLQDLDLSAVTAAFEQYRRNPANKTFPLPAVIREMINPTVVSKSDMAQEIAARIREAVVKFGHSNPVVAMNHIGPVGWKVVGRFGGWNYICQELGVTINPDSLYAQARELIKAHMELDRTGQLDNPEMLNYSSNPVLETRSAPGLESVGSILKQITDKK